MELKNYILHSPVDLVDCVIDEVALEGLDGITLEALWQRLAIRFHENLPLTESLMEQVWSICVNVKGFSFFELKKAREKLIIFDRFELLNEDEPKKANVPKDIYPHFPIDDMRNGIRGSCSSYNTRTDITFDARNYSLEDIVHHYDQKFVIVASQSLRERALIGDTACPVMEMNVVQYCFLERVGRARYHGDVSHGKTGLSTLSDDPKSMFYHRKFLLKQKLITKQAYSERVSGNSYSSSLLHLARFYVERRPKFILMSEIIINYLKTKENYIASYDEVKEKLQINVPLRKIFKTPFLKNIIRTDIKVPCENLHSIDKNDWQKNGYTLSEKLVRAVQLLDANVDINQFWGKHDVPEEEESYDLDISKQKLNFPFLKQANRFVEESRQGGLSQTELGAKLGMTKLHTRTILRNLAKTKIVATYMNDVGKQRVTKYISKKFEHSSEMSKQLEHEMDKMKEFNRTSREEQIEILPPNVPIEVPIEVIYPMNEEIMVTNKLQHEEVRKDERLFPSINRILKKYKALKSRACFKYTALNLSQLHATAFWHPSQNQSGLIQNPENQNISIEKTPIKDVKVKLVCSKPQSLSKSKTVTGFLENLKNSEKKNVTYRLLKRANLVIEAVKASKVIDDASKLLKLIKAEEDKEGYDVRIDKKSLARLLQRLAKDNLVKYIKLILNDGERQKIVTYICDPTIDKNHSLIQSVVEQAKIKFCLLRAPNVRVSKKGSLNERKRKRGTVSVDNPKELTSFDVDVVLDSRIGKKYGYNPKFLRMKSLHILLFYLIYEHPGHLNTSKQEQIEKLRNEVVSIDDQLATEMPEVFTNEVDWKMFIPPLPKHPGWSNGWALMTDVLLRLPLSIFTKIYNIPYVVPEIESYLDHPIKRHFLVKDVSSHIRHLLLKSRKYIFSVHETITRLCYLGLAQFGPQKLKEKDQVFLFLNRRTQLLNTTSSSMGYHKIEDKAYPVIKYEFQSLPDVEKYWFDMWEICTDTCLGGRLAVQGKDILLEDLSRKTAMVLAAKPRSPEEVLGRDNGEVPGDRQGAAGIDSAFFAHLKRNWTWGSSNYTYNHYKTSSSQRSRIEDFGNTTLEEVIEKSAQQHTNQKESPKDAKAKKTAKAKSKPKIPVKPKTPVKAASIKTVPVSQPRKKAYVRRVMPRKQTVRNRVKYDEIDYRALQRMDKLRVDWEPHEDNILLMCKVAMMYLFPNPRKQFVSFIAVRDALRSYSSSSQNKTSRACQRRLLYMLKQPQTISSVMLGIEEIKQNYFVNKRFGGLVDRIKGECHNPTEYEDKVAKVFKELVAYIAKKYYSISNMEPKDPIIMPHTVQEFNLLYELKHPSKTLREKGFTTDVQNTNDIHSATLNSVIHSWMCSDQDRRTWAYQLSKVYQQYSETLLKAAMLKIRTDQMASVRKPAASTFNKYGNCMPMSNSQYQLSLSYYYKFQTKWPYSVFSESYNLLLRLIQWHAKHQSADCNYAVPRGVKGTEVLPITGGIVAGIHDLFAKDQLDFDIEMPDQIIMLDPRLQEKDEQYIKIAKRYQSLLMNYAYANESAGPRGDVNFEVETQRVSDLECMDVEREEEEEEFDQEGQEVNQEDTEVRHANQERKLDHEQNQREENTIFLEEPQINWNQNEGTRCVEMEEVNVRNLKRCIESEDEDHVLIEKRPRLETEDRVSIPVSKRPRNETEEESEEINKIIREKCIGARTQKQYYAYNLKKMQTLLKTIREPSRSLQRALALQQQHFEAGLQSAGENLNESQAEDEIERENKIERRNEFRGESEFEKENESERENEMLREILDGDPLQVDHDETDEQNYSTRTRASIDPNDPNDPKYTRLGMLKMREEFNKISVKDSHHAHDFFVVNSFNIFYSLKLPEIEGSRKLAVHKEYIVPAEIIPLNFNLVNKLISKIKTNAVFPKNHVSYEEFQQLVIKNSNLEWKLLDKICRFIKKRKELGASLQEIAETFHELGETLCDILSILAEYRQILRSGVTVVRFIHNQHIDPWLINSYKIRRLEQEAQPLVPKGSVYVLNNVPKTPKQNCPRKSNTKSPRPLEILESDPNEVTMEEINSEDLEEPNRLSTSEGGDPSEDQPRRSSRKTTGLLKQIDVDKDAQMLDFDSAEEIKVVIKPWIRLDGALNRRVLDRMMGAVLSYCIKHPGATLRKVQNKFVPALQPFHTRELVEMLVEMECLNVKVLKSPRASLYTKPVKLQFSGIPGLAQDEDIVIESEIEATLRFGTYLSSKTYSSDFLS